MKITANAKPEDAGAAYWNGPITRKEVQEVLDVHANIIQALLRDVHGSTETGQDGLIAIIAKLDMTLAFVMDRLGVSPEEFQKYINAKMEEFLAIQAKAKEAAEAAKTAEKPVGNKSDIRVN
jgi:energy-converting hydrogenase A subunit M